MEEIQNYLCSNEVCIEKVRAGLVHTMAELYEHVGRNVATSIQRIVRDTFFSSNFYFKDDNIKIYFFDELEPGKITDYLMRKKEYPVERQYVYELVCRIQQKMINQFYKELDTYKTRHVIENRIPKNSQLFENKQYKRLESAYGKALDRRANSPYKRILANKCE